MPEPTRPLLERLGEALDTIRENGDTTAAALPRVLEAIAPELADADRARTIDSVIGQTHAPRVELEEERERAAALSNVEEAARALDALFDGAPGAWTLAGVDLGENEGAQALLSLHDYLNDVDGASERARAAFEAALEADRQDVEERLA